MRTDQGTTGRPGTAALLAVSVMLGILSCPALHAAESALVKAKANYARLSQKIGDDHLVISSNILKGYVSSIDDAMKKCQAEGDLESVLALQKEQKRLQKMKSIPPKEAAGESKVLASLIQAAMDRRSDAEKSRIDKLRTLNERYGEHLDRLKAELTKQGDIDGAVEAKKEKERLAAAIKELDARSPAGKPGDTAGKPPVDDGAATAVPPPTPNTRPCHACKGTGKGLKACPTCSGRGTCSRCGGLGTSGVGLTGQPRKCLTCKATGRCRGCDGKMTLPASGACTTCKGKGSVARPSHYPPRPAP